MCGIVGCWSQGGWTEAHTPMVLRMRDALEHRGPDEGGKWVDEVAGIGLGHRRLSIIDLSPAGSQPMRSADGRWTIAFNGEIYNFRETRAELAALGHSFRGGSDTEVLLEAIAHWGVAEAIKRAAGMFALAIWDAQDRALHLARDRFGEKPLYYGWAGDDFVFGSELPSVTASGRFVNAEIDRVAVAQLLRYSCIPAPASILSGVRKLEPAMILTVGADRSMRQERYWSLGTSATSVAATTSIEASADRLEAQLRETVSQQMISDVPLGALLSGGVDSSLVVAMMSRVATRPVRTFSVGFREAGFDEAVHAGAVAAHLGAEHTELYMTPQDALEVVPSLAAIYGEPFADASQLPSVLIARLARSRVTVALTGDGGDEIFGGYSRYTRGPAMWRSLSRIPVPLRHLVARALGAVPSSIWSRLEGLRSDGNPSLPLADRIRKLTSLLPASDRRDFYDRARAYWPASRVPVLGIEGATGWRPIRARVGDDDGAFVEEMMLNDAESYMTDDVLVKVDRAAMSASLETRAPFLDHRVAELAWSLPLAHRVEAGTGKRVLRTVLERHVPRALLDRPKMGFAVPIGAWLRGPLRGWAEDLLAESRLQRQGLLDVAPVRQIWLAHRDGRAEHAYALWNVLMLQAWLR